MKRELEDAIAALSFSQYIIFRPSPLKREGTDRLGERIMVPVLKAFNAIGLFKQYKPLPTEVLAQKLAKAPHKLPIGNSVVAMEDIFKF